MSATVTNVVYSFVQRLNGTTSQRSGALSPGKFYTLHVGAAPVRVKFGNASALPTADVLTGAPVGAYSTLTFLADSAATHIAVIHYDGSAVFDSTLMKTSA